MDWRIAGEDVVLIIETRLGGQFVIPDPGSLTLTVRDNGGAPISGYDQLALSDSTLSSTIVTIAASANAIDAGALFETRYVSLSYRVAGRPLSRYIRYRLSPFIPIQGTPDDVRALVGADQKELPDEDIDLVEAYFFLLNEQGNAFKDALSSTTAQGIYANKAVELQAALETLPGLPGKMSQMEAFNNAQRQRPKLDFEALRNDLQSRLQDALNLALSAETVTPILFRVTTPVDVITGA